MGNQQTALSGIHPFKDPSDFEPEDLISTGPPLSHPPITQQRTQPPQTIITLDTGGSVSGNRTNTNVSFTGDADYSDLIMRPPTPPPRRASTTSRTRGQRFARLLKVDLFSKHLSLKSLPRQIPKMISRPDLSKLGTVLRFKKKRPVAGEYYPVPPDAERPSPPSKADVLHEQDEYFLLRWECPAYDGGLPIIGYVIQHVELGLPQIDNNTQVDDTQSWYSSEPGQVTSTEVLLNNLIPGTTYQFRIIAENLLGFSQPGDISDPIVFNPNGELDDWFCPPVLITPLDDSYVVIEHERLCLTIEVTGQPYPIVKWFDKNEQEMNKTTNSEKYSTVSSGQKRVLTINSVEIHDAGVVRCVAENEKGVIEHSTRLVVEAPPHIRRVQHVELLRLQNPYELTEQELRVIEEKTKKEGESEEDLIFQAGEQARLKFMYSGAPKPNVCVYHEGDLVDGEETGGHAIPLSRRRVITEVTENLITVKIPNVRRSDRGEWIVRLDNVLGEDAAIVLITVSDRPSEPGKPDVLQLSDNTCILKWDKPYDDGGCPVQGYIVEYYRSEWGVWLKAVTTKNPYTKIRDLIPGSKYKFRVKAENLYGMSNPSAESVEILITDLASTLRSFAGDNEATLLMKPVMEEEEDEAVALEQNQPDLSFVRPTPPKRKPIEIGSTGSLRVSTSTMTELTAIKKTPIFTDSLRPEPRISRTPSPGRSPGRSPSPRLLQVSLQPQVVVLPEDDQEVLEPPVIQPRRSVSPTRALIRTTVQQLNEEEDEYEDSQFLTTRSRHSPRPPSVSPKRSPVRFEEPLERKPPRHEESTHPPTRPQRHAHVTHVQAQFKVEEEPQKKLYSRAEIIRSAAANQFDYYVSPEEPDDEEESYLPRDEPEEDPELAKVREILSKHDEQDMEDEEYSAEYDVDFDKLQQEYEEDKKRGMVSRQDSGVSNKSFTRDDSLEISGMSRQESLQESEELEEDEDVPRSRSVQAEHLVSEARGFERVRTLPFERAQSEVVVRRTTAQASIPEPKKPESGFSSQAAQEEPVEEERIVNLPPRPRVRTPPRNAESSRPFLHDRYTDYIAMKASSRNPKVGSSLRSLSSSRYSSTESIPRRGSSQRERDSEEEHGEIEKTQQRLISPRFQFRDFDPEVEKESLNKLEKSAPNKHFKSKSLTLPYDLVHPVQTMKVTPRETRINATSDEYQVSPQTDRKQPPSSLNYTQELPTSQHPNISPTSPNYMSTPEIYAAAKPSRASVLEHSRSETNVDTGIPDSTLKYLAGDYLEDEYTEEEYSEGAVLECVLTIDKNSLRETYNVSEIRETSPVGFVDRDVPREREDRSRGISLSSVDEMHDYEEFAAEDERAIDQVKEIMERMGEEIDEMELSEQQDNYNADVQDQLAEKILDTLAEIRESGENLEELERLDEAEYEEKVEAAVFGRIDAESLRRIEKHMREEIAGESKEVEAIEQAQTGETGQTLEEVEESFEKQDKIVENVGESEDAQVETQGVSEETHEPSEETQEGAVEDQEAAKDEMNIGQEIHERENEPELEVLIHEGLEDVEVVWEEDTGEDFELETEEIAYEGDWEEVYEGEEEIEIGDDEVFEMEGDYEESQEDEDYAEEEAGAEYTPLDVNEFKFKALEEMQEPEYAEKNSQIDDLLSKLDKFLLENPEEEREEIPSAEQQSETDVVKVNEEFDSQQTQEDAEPTPAIEFERKVTPDQLTKPDLENVTLDVEVGESAVPPPVENIEDKVNEEIQTEITKIPEPERKSEETKEQDIAQVEDPTAQVEELETDQNVAKPTRKTEESEELMIKSEAQQVALESNEKQDQSVVETHITEKIEETTLVTDIVDEILTLEIEKTHSAPRKHSTAEIKHEKAEEPQQPIVNPPIKPSRAVKSAPVVDPKAPEPEPLSKPTRMAKPALEEIPKPEVKQKAEESSQPPPEVKAQRKYTPSDIPERKRKTGAIRHEESYPQPFTKPETETPEIESPSRIEPPPPPRSLIEPLNYDKKFQDRPKLLPLRKAKEQEPPPPSGYRPTMSIYYETKMKSTPRGSSESVRSSDDRRSFAPLHEILEQEALARTLEPLQWTPKIPERYMDSIPEQNTQEPAPKPKPPVPDTSSYRPNMSVYFERQKASSSHHQSRESLASRLQSSEDLSISTRSSTPSSFAPLRALTKPKTTDLADLLVELNKPQNKLSPPESSEPSIIVEITSPKQKRRLRDETVEVIKSLDLPPPPPRPSSFPLRLLQAEEDYEVEQPSPFMSYVYSFSFYLLLSPMFLFVDSLYVALLCMLLIASVRFFILR